MFFSLSVWREEDAETMINTEVLIAYLAMGSIGKLLTLRYPTPGQQWAAIVEVIAGSVAIGFLAQLLLPGADGYKAIIFAGVPFFFGALGRWLAPLLDRVRMVIKGRRDHGPKAQSHRTAGAGD